MHTWRQEESARLAAMRRTAVHRTELRKIHFVIFLLQVSVQPNVREVSLKCSTIKETINNLGPCIWSLLEHVFPLPLKPGPLNMVAAAKTYKKGLKQKSHRVFLKATAARGAVAHHLQMKTTPSRYNGTGGEKKLVKCCFLALVDLVEGFNLPQRM